jgi:PTS system nitrogen regulatory IIA component
MDIKDFFAPADAIVGLRVADKLGLLKELSSRAADRLALDSDRIVQAVLGREALGSTGMGGGLAIPHARIDGLQKPFGLLARTRRPIAFDAIDSQPVDLIFLLLLPANPQQDHLHALASVARALRDRKIAGELRRARDGQHAYRCLVGDPMRS